VESTLNLAKRDPVAGFEILKQLLLTNFRSREELCPLLWGQLAKGWVVNPGLGGG
jgi:hypothetical protein